MQYDSGLSSPTNQKQAMRILILSIITLCALGCATKKTTLKTGTDLKAEQIIGNAIKAHGGTKYDDAHYQFVFRDKTYTFKNDKEGYTYTLNQEKDGRRINDVLKNGTITRTVDGQVQDLSPKQKTGYSSGVNSVIYFATLPYKLQDQSVNKSYVETQTIKGQSYDVIHITFDEEGGGKDHDDNFYYWINQKTSKIDYLAYNYAVGKGGVRFRSAYNTRIVGGISFQDYVNYKAPVGTPLVALPSLFESDQLTKLSVIATEDVVELFN